MNVLIVEPDVIAAHYLSNIVSYTGNKTIGVAKNIKEANVFITQLPDVVFLAINLADDDSGVDLAATLNIKQIPFIYITNDINESIIAKAVNTNPSGYYNKPVNQRDIVVALALMAMRIKISITDITFKTIHGERNIPMKDVLYIMSDNVHIQLHTQHKQYSQRCTLKSFEILNQAENLMRIHRSYIVNVNKISKIEDGFALINNNKIPIARAHKKRIEAYFFG